MHGADTSQNAWQLILPDVSQPLCDGVLNHFVYTEETGHIADKKQNHCLLFKHTLPLRKSKYQRDVNVISIAKAYLNV